MTQKSLTNLTIILLAGIALFLARDWWNQYRQKQPNEYQQKVQSFNKDTVESIRIAAKDQTLELKKEDGTWKLATKAADLAQVQELTTALFPTEPPLLVAESEAQQKNLGIKSDDVKTVALKTGTQELTFKIGKSIQGGYAVAIGEEPRVYALMDLPSLNLEPESWYDLKITDIDGTQIKKLSWERGINSFSVVKGDNNSWKFEGSETEANGDGIQTFTMSLNPFKAGTLAFDRKIAQYNQTTSALRLIITTQDDKTITLDFYKGLNDYLVKRTPKDEYFVVPQADFDRMNKEKSGFEKSK